MRFRNRFALTATLIMTLFAPLGAAGGHRLALGRDGDGRDPVKIIRRIVVWIFDELGVPKP